MFFSRKQGIGGDPATQFRSKLASLFHRGFGHQDDKFVSAVAGYNVGAPAIGFKNLADPLQDKIAFQVAVEIVHELEAVQIHEDESEGAAGTRGTLPFGGKRFHEEPVRLDVR